VSDWIKCSERLPDNKTIDNVLITDGIDIYVAVEWWPNENPLETYWSYSSCCGCKVSNITHWQPLPAPPELQE